MLSKVAKAGWGLFVYRIAYILIKYPWMGLLGRLYSEFTGAFGLAHNKKGPAMKKILFAILASLALATASNTYMEIDGIPGGVLIAGKEGTVEVLNLNHRIIMPTDAQTGALTGVRKHQVLEILKAIDKSSPYLAQKITTAAVIPSVTIKVYNISPEGQEVAFYEIKLTNARVTEFQTSTSVLDGEPLTLEKVSFTYQRIQWTYFDGNLQHQDDWSLGR